MLKSVLILELPELEMRACGVIGSDFMYYTEKIGSIRKEVGFHGFIAMVVGTLFHLHSRYLFESI